MALKYLHGEGNARRMGRGARIAVACGCVAVLLAGAEGAARLLMKPAESAPRVAGIASRAGRMVLKPDSEFLCEGKPVRINALGMRGGEPVAGAVNIALLGGDSVFGGRIPVSSDTLAECLAARLQGPRAAAAKADAPGATVATAAPAFVVVNAGSPMMDAREARELVAKTLAPKLIPSKVQAVVVLVGYGDLLAVCGKDGESAATGSAGNETAPASPGFFRSLALVRLIAGDADTAVGVAAPRLSEPEIRRGLAAFAANLTALVKDCDAAGMGCVLATEPGAAASRSPGLAPEREALAASMGLDANGLERVLTDMRAAMESVAELGARSSFVDLAAEVSGISAAPLSGVRAEEAAASAAKESAYYAPVAAGLGPGLTRAGNLRAAEALERALVRGRPWAGGKHGG